VPSLWLLAEKDRSAPSAETRAALDTLRAGGRPCRTILFPGADHTMLVFREENGARVYTGYHPDYYRTEAEMVARLAGLAPPAP